MKWGGGESFEPVTPGLQSPLQGAHFPRIYCFYTEKS